LSEQCQRLLSGCAPRGGSRAATLDRSGGRCVMGHTSALYRNWENCVEENQKLRQELHERERTIEHLVQANHALHDELAAARARIAALENQLDELGEGAYRAAAERDNRYVPQLHEWKERAEIGR